MKKVFLLISVFIFFGFSLHKYHLSLTKILFKNDALQVTMRYFIDDIETTINKKENIISELGTDRELKNIDSLLVNYLSENFKISINKQSKKLNYIGKEFEKDIVYFYFEIDSVFKINTIEVQNKVLLNAFEDQQNIVKLTVNNQKETLYLKNKNDKKLLKFNN